MYHPEDEGCEHEPGCPVLTGDGDCTCPPRVIRVSEGTNIHAIATCFVGVSHCCCPPPDSAFGAVLDSVDNGLVVRNASGILGPGDRFEGAVSVYATAVSGNEPFEIRYHLVGDDGNGATTNLAQHTAKIWSVRITHEPITRDRSGSVFYNPCGIVRNETATFRFQLEPAAFPATNINWSVDLKSRADFVGGTNGQTVVVHGKETGNVKLSVDITGYRGPPPVFNASVVNHHEVLVKAFVVEEEDGGPVYPPGAFVFNYTAATEIYTQAVTRPLVPVASTMQMRQAPISFFSFM